MTECVTCVLAGARCIEELQILKYERQRTLQYYAHVRDTCNHKAVQLDKAESLLDDVKSQVRASLPRGSSSDSKAAVNIVGLQRQLEDYAQFWAEAVLLEHCAQQHEDWRIKAVAAFGTLRT